MTNEKRGNHDKKEDKRHGEDCKEVGVKADESADSQEREGMGGNLPREETYEARLPDEKDSAPAYEVS